MEVLSYIFIIVVIGAIIFAAVQGQRKTKIEKDILANLKKINERAETEEAEQENHKKEE